ALVRCCGTLPCRRDCGGVPRARLAADDGKEKRAAASSWLRGSPIERNFIFQGRGHADDLYGRGFPFNEVQRRGGEAAGKREDHSFWQGTEPQRPSAYPNLSLYEKPGKH